MSLQVFNLNYILPIKDILFSDISFSVPAGTKAAIVGNNGVGKSTLLHIIAGKILAASGEVSCYRAYLVPQHLGQYDDMTVADALQITGKYQALKAILAGDASMENFSLLDDDWTLEERVMASFGKWGISHIKLESSFATLSGGEKTKVFLAGIDIHTPSVILMDEPTNHLDMESREMLYDYLCSSNDTILVVSHDRALLNKLNHILHMTRSDVKYYPMCYDDFEHLYEQECENRMNELDFKQRELAKTKRVARTITERQQKHAERGAKLSDSKCLARISKGNLKSKSEASSARIRKVHEDKVRSLRQDITELRSIIPDESQMKVDLSSSNLHAGKKLVELINVNFAYPNSTNLWSETMNLTLYSGDRVWIRGRNGQGKTTLIRIMTGALLPTTGSASMTEGLTCICLDQEYSIIDDNQTVYEQILSSGTTLPEHELKMRLHRFLFPKDTWDKRCGCLSGGEKMRLSICFLMVCDAAPDMIVVDEPTNNIDIANMGILSKALREYQGTLVVISHDERFVGEVGIEKTINLPNRG